MNALLYYLIVINIVTFLVYGIDKWKAKQGSWRISEATLLILAVIGGCIGVLLGMKVWRHKTQHKKFKYGLPLILLAQEVQVWPSADSVGTDSTYFFHFIIREEVLYR